MSKGERMSTHYDRASLRQNNLPQRTMRQTLRALWKTVLPSLFMVVLSIVFAAPFRILGQGELQTGLVLGTVWFWSLYRPASMPIWLLLISGLIIELFVSTPPGLLLLWMLVVYGVAHMVRFHFAEGGFFRYWGLYSLTVLVGAVLEWCLLSVRAMMILSPSALFFQWSLSVGVYPLLHVVFVLGRHFSHPSDHP